MISGDPKLKGNDIYANRMSHVSLSSIVFVMVLLANERQQLLYVDAY